MGPAQVAAMQPQMDKARAEAVAKGAVLPDRAMPRQTASAQRLTRIAEQCAAAAK